MEVSDLMSLVREQYRNLDWHIIRDKAHLILLCGNEYGDYEALFSFPERVVLSCNENTSLVYTKITHNGKWQYWCLSDADEGLLLMEHCL